VEASRVSKTELSFGLANLESFFIVNDVLQEDQDK